MSTITLELDLAQHSPDVIAHVLHILNGTPVTNNPAATPATKADTPAAEVKSAEAKPQGETKITVESLRALAAEKKSTAGAEKIKALLTEFGAASITALDESRYQDFFTALNAL